MTDRLTEIRQRLEKATKGPWEYEYSGSGDYEIHSKAFERRGDRTLAKLWRSYTDSGEYFALDNADANFIANSKADVEFLLQEINSLTAKLEKAKEALETPCPACSRMQEQAASQGIFIYSEACSKCQVCNRILSQL